MQTGPISSKTALEPHQIAAKLAPKCEYVFLIALTTGFFVLTPEFPSGSRRIFIGLLAGGLIVFAASFLTRMRLEFLAAIERLEARRKEA
jgi:hypothetical protein